MASNSAESLLAKMEAREEIDRIHGMTDQELRELADGR